MAVLASLPNLRLLVVDEEHDPSYKQQEGARYSARDLAVYRARLESADAAHPHGACRVLLGSATPSLESWQATITGRYQRLNMSERIGAGTPTSVGATGLPTVKSVDMNHQPKHCVIAPPLLAAIGERVARGEQSLIFLNRRGYAPVLACHDCDWKSECPHCSAYRVFHKIDRSLRCHHCGFTERVPRACPSCGNIDIAPVGRGTERLEEHLAELLAGVTRPDGGAVRITRIDADSTRLKGSLESQLASVHAGEVDVLVGTQMIAKGHDFRHITLVAAINPDGALFSSDFRAPERLFGLLMQAGGRAGRDARHSAASEMWVQTFHPGHPLFAALRRHDYPAFAAQQLAERRAAGLSPFGFSALVRAEAKAQEVAQGFLNAAAAAAPAQLPGHSPVTAYPAVPMTIQRVANIERAQMLVESPSRAALQRFLAAWQPMLFETRKQGEFKSLVRWAIDVDPMVI
jgi:primosomal protein N' (replication factor Y)